MIWKVTTGDNRSCDGGLSSCGLRPTLDPLSVQSGGEFFWLMEMPCVFDPQGVLFEHQTGLVDVRSCSTKAGVELGPLLFPGPQKRPRP